MREIWKKIPGFSRYEASNIGNIRSINYKNSDKIKKLKPAISEEYLKTVLLDDSGKYKSIRIHRIIALTFLGFSELEVNHIDGNKLNNNINNLEYCTRSQNLLHAYKIGLEKPLRGEKNKSSKLTEIEILEIREYAQIHGKLKNRKYLAEKYNVTESHLKDIVSRRRGLWGHLN